MKTSHDSLIKRLTAEQMLVAKFLYAYGVKIHHNFGEKIDNADLARLKVRLTAIAVLGTDLGAAYQRYVKPTDERGYVGIGTEWDKDKRAILIAAAFFMDKQTFLPFKPNTIDSRIRRVPLDLLSYMPGTNLNKEAEKWLKGIVAIAKGFFLALKKWDSSQKDNKHQTVFDFLGYKIINSAGLSDEDLKPFLDYIKNGTQFIDSKLAYGNIRITTSKEIKSGNALAYYSSGTDEISILIDKKNYSDERAFVHEMGHRLWYKFMTHEQRTEVRKIYNQGSLGTVTKQDFIEFYYSRAMAKSAYTAIDKAGRASPEVAKVIEEATKAITKRTAELIQKVIDFAKQHNIEPESEKIIRRGVSDFYFTGGGFKWSNNPFFAKLADATKDMPDSFYKSLKSWWQDSDTSAAYHALIVSINKAFSVDDLFPTNYSKTNESEFFAENYSFYKMNKQISNVMKTLITSVL